MFSRNTVGRCRFDCLIPIHRGTRRGDNLGTKRAGGAAEPHARRGPPRVSVRLQGGAPH
jgi:hypothetical protein